VRASGDSATPAGAPDVPPPDRVGTAESRLERVQRQIEEKEKEREEGKKERKEWIEKYENADKNEEKTFFSGRINATDAFLAGLDAALAKLRDQETALLPQTAP